MRDEDLFALLSSNDPAVFEAIRAEIGTRLNALFAKLLFIARKRASDLDSEEVRQNVMNKAFEILADQHLGKEPAYRFDPALAPFDAWLFNLMGGAGTRGIIDTMRSARRRDYIRLQFVDNAQALDEAAQEHTSGGRWKRAGTFTSLRQTGDEIDSSDIDVRELLSTLSPRESLILRLEIGLEPNETLCISRLRDIVGASGFNPDEELGILKRALGSELIGKAITQKGLATLLGLSTRSIRKLTSAACQKLRSKYFAGDLSMHTKRSA
jgi:DNA-directed RNA polymerase specialized sigma24 family protein